MKLYSACTDDFKATTAPFPEASKSVEAPKCSGPCPVLLPHAHVRHTDVPKYADFGRVKVGRKIRITRCQELRFYLCMG